MEAFVVLENGPKNVYLKTDPTGKFELSSVPKGGLSMVFSRKDFLSEEISIKSGEIVRNPADTIEVKVYLSPVELMEKFVFSDIYFFTDTDKIRPESNQDLQKLLEMMKTKPELFIEIQGHMNFPDNRGATPTQKKYNYDLSYRRAKAVREFLIQNGIERTRMIYKGMSNFQPVYPNPKNEWEGNMNKRVEVWTLKVDR